MKNIVIFGCRKITIDVLSHIVENYSDVCRVTGVVTHDEERDRVYYPELVSEYCERLGIPWVRFAGPIDKTTIEGFNPDLIFSLYYRKILKQEILDIPSMGCVNIHPAFLPNGRGPAPSLWNVLVGDKFAGSTMHYMVSGVDAGDIISQKRIKIGDATGFDLNVRLSSVGVDLFKKDFLSILSGANKRIKQIHCDATYCLPFSVSLRYIYWDNPDYILNQLRAFAKPYEGALTWTAKGASIIIWKAKKLTERVSFRAPGVFDMAGDNIIVQTGTLPVLVTDYEVTNGSIKNKGRFMSGPLINKE